MIAGPGGWSLAPEGAAVHAESRTAVVADVHLGYEWARAAGGDVVPPHSLAETVGKLARLLDRAKVDRLVVAGDLVESSGPCPRTSADVRRLRDWLAARGVELVPIQGNHDPRRVPPLPSRLVIGGWTVAHGDRPLKAARTITGHLHPVLRFEGVTAPCFVVGPTSLVLPAFSPNAAGLNVLGLGAPASWRSPGVRCVAGTGDALLDFGSIADLEVRLAGDRS